LIEISKEVEKYLEKPYALSALGTGVGGEIYYDYLAFFHLILVKKGKKNGFVVPVSVKNAVKICKKLNLKFKKDDWHNYEECVSENNSLSKETTEKIKKMRRNRIRVHQDVLCGTDDAILEKFCSGNITNEKLGEFEQYPKCCIKQFTDNVWGDFVQAAEIIGDTPQNAEMILNVSRAGNADERIFQRLKKIQLEFADGRKKFPYLFHQACTDCLNDMENSPSGKLNKEWGNVAKEFPKLDSLIMQGGIDESEDKKRLWDKEWQEWIDGGCLG
tara:strand:- start:598 stop:1416 length:819 start_codon:yes stop_codon:yes gene_type:complete